MRPLLIIITCAAILSMTPNDSLGDTADTTVALDCSQAIPLALGEFASGDNTGLPNNATEYPHGLWGASGMTGGEQIYVLEIDQQYGIIGLSLESETLHSVALLSACDTQDIRWANTTSSRVSEVFSLAPGTYYIVVDSRLSTEGSYTVSTGAELLLPGAERCDSPEIPELEPRSHPISYIGSGSASVGDYTIPPGGCQGGLPSGVDGTDMVYAVILNEDTTLDITHASEPFYLTTDCTDSGACVAGADGVPWNAEAFSYTHQGATTMYYLVFEVPVGIVHFSYRHNGDEGGIVAVENENWGSLKSMYR